LRKLTLKNKGSPQKGPKTYSARPFQENNNTGQYNQEEYINHQDQTPGRRNEQFKGEIRSTF